MPTPPRSDDVGRFVQQALSESDAGPLSRPVQVPSAIDEVTDRLLTAIAIGEFVPGERLPAERTLAHMLGVSRSTVHQAMGRLRSAGIVEVRRGRAGGAFVRNDWSSNSAEAVARTLGARWSQLEELCDLRGLVEAMIARTAAERRTGKDIIALRSALTGFAHAKTPQQEHAADMAIHRAVAEATGYPQVGSLTRGLLATITLGFPIEPYSPYVYDRALEEHTALVDAVVEGNVEQAGRIAQNHFAMTTRTLQSVLARGLAPAPPATPPR